MRKFSCIFCLLTLFTNLAISQDFLEVFSDSVIITASKVPTPEKKSIKPAIIISKDDIANSLGMDLSQILNEYAGIQINGAFSNPAKDRSVYLRGAGGEYTLFLVDGLPVNDPSSIGAPIDIRHFSLEQIEKIEIIKGSHSSLYGSDAVAGVINIITKKILG